MTELHFNDLFYALINCFLIILFGYAAGRLNLITSTQSHGIGKFIGVFALPALLFKNMIELDFSTVSWTFMLAIFLAKAIVFFGVIGITLFILRRKGIGRSGLYAIFVTQSNDFALGYPIVKVLYQNTYPELLQYIYLVAPISLLILNPIGLLLMEVEKQWKLKEANKQKQMVTVSEQSATCNNCPVAENCPAMSSTSNSSNDNQEESKGLCKILLKSFFLLLLNPIVFMVFIGLAFHFIFSGEVPGLLKPLLSTLSEAFSATALFYLGLSMVGKIEKQIGIRLFVPGFLIVAKILIVPILARVLLLLLNNSIPVINPHSGLTDNYARINGTGAENMTYLSLLSNFAFLYGTFPTAPTVVIYAAKYGLEVDRVATAMVVCTILSAPIMYVSAWTLTISFMDFLFYKSEVAVVGRDMSIIGLLTSIWCAVVFIFSKKFQRLPHLMTFVLTLAMMFAAFMSVISGFAIQVSSPTPNKIIGFFFMFTGIQASRFCGASLALVVVVLKYYGEEKVRRLQRYLIATPFVIAAINSIIVCALGTPMSRSRSNPVFMFGEAQDAVSLATLLISFLISIISLILLFRHPQLFSNSSNTSRRSSSYQPSHQGSDSLIENEDSDSSDSSLLSLSEEDDGRWWKYSSGDPQIGRHIFLLLLLCVSLLIGIVLTAWRLTKLDESGIYFEIGFLDSVFNFGQALFVFFIFGFDEELILDPLLQIWYRVRGKKSSTLAPLSELNEDILHQCHVFVKHHLNTCKRALLQKRRYGLSTYNNVLTGTGMCSWLVEVGLAADRQEAVRYGQHLVEARLLRHVTVCRDFYDRNFLYQFETPSTREILNDEAAEEGQLAPPSCPLRRCSRRPKQYSFEQYLNEPDPASLQPERNFPHHLNDESNQSESSFSSGEPSTSTTSTARKKSTAILKKEKKLSRKRSRSQVEELMDW